NTGDLVNKDGLDCSAGEITVAISEATLDSDQIKLYPNPVHNYLQVEFSNSTMNSDWQICSLEGKIVLSGRMNLSTGGIDCSGLTNGMYVFKWTDGSQSNQKIFIKH